MTAMPCIIHCNHTNLLRDVPILLQLRFECTIRIAQTLSSRARNLPRFNVVAELWSPIQGFLPLAIIRIQKTSQQSRSDCNTKKKLLNWWNRPCDGLIPHPMSPAGCLEKDSENLNSRGHQTSSWALGIGAASLNLAPAVWWLCLPVRGVVTVPEVLSGHERPCTNCSGSRTFSIGERNFTQ
jgi:hypothetical protein